MAKKVTGYIKLQIPAGKATPAPPVGPALGQHGLCSGAVSPLPLRTAARPSPPPPSKSNRLRCFQSLDLTGLGRITPPLFQLQSLSTTGTAAHFNLEMWIGCGEQLWLGRKRGHHKTAFSPVTALLPGLSNAHTAEKRSPPSPPHAACALHSAPARQTALFQADHHFTLSEVQNPGSLLPGSTRTPHTEGLRFPSLLPSKTQTQNT